MDEHIGTILEILGGVVVIVYGGVLVWITKRLLKLEDEMKDDLHVARVELAVMERGQTDLRLEWEKAEQRNTDEHSNIMSRINSNHTEQMSRLDALVSVFKSAGFSRPG